MLVQITEFHSVCTKMGDFEKYRKAKATIKLIQQLIVLHEKQQQYVASATELEEEEENPKKKTKLADR